MTELLGPYYSIVFAANRLLRTADWVGVRVGCNAALCVVAHITLAKAIHSYNCETKQKN